MATNWRPKSVRNNNFTSAFERSRLATQGIYLGAYAGRKSDSPSPTPMTMSATIPPRPDSRFAQSSQPPTKAQLESYIRNQQAPERWDGGYLPERRPDGVREEKLGRRDTWISSRHRLWGEDAPMVDIDFVVVEYNKGACVALVEYKCAVTDWGKAFPPPNLKQANYRVLIDMADRMKVPLLIVYYDRKAITFTCYFAGKVATEQLAKGRESVLLSEEEWVERLYMMRGGEMPASIRATLSKTK